jgi:hypothetical protein
MRLLLMIMVLMTTCVNAQEVTANTVAQDPNAILDLVLLALPWIVTLATIVINMIKNRRAGKTWEESFTILINTLKDEAKMKDGGFSKDAVDKANAVAKVIGAGKDAQDKVEAALTEGKEQDIKIGSINGKPIYLGNALGIGSALAGILKGFRK